MPKTSSRIKSLLPLALLVASWQFSASALGQTVIISPGVAASSPTPTKSRELATGRVRPTGGHAKVFGVDGSNCITSVNQEKQPAPGGGDSPNAPDSSSDIDDTDGGLDDFSADNPMRNDQDTPHFSVSGTGAAGTRMPRIVPVLLFPVHCFYCLHEHIRERAPPKRGLTILNRPPALPLAIRHSAFGTRHSLASVLLPFR
jgi:hypothetical protein